MSSLRFASIAVSLSLLAGCGAEENPSSGAAGSAGVPAGAGAGAAAGVGGSAGAGGASGQSAGGTGGEPLAGEQYTTSSASIGPVAAIPGGDETVCIHKRLGNAEAGFARRVRGHLTDGSHHMIVYLSEETEERLEPERCGGFSGIFNFSVTGGVPGLDSTDIPVFIAQKHEESLVLPYSQDDGRPVGFRIEKDQMLRIELHWFNTTSEEQQVTGAIDFDLVPEDADVVESSFGFWGTAEIDIPPRSEWSTPVMFQRALAGTRAYAVTTHQHRFGTRMRIWNDSSLEPSDENLIADGRDWAEPPLEMLEPHLAFDVGQGLTYQCEWRNDGDRKVGFGEGFDDEMCFLWMYYYPSLGFDFCINISGSPTGGICNHVVR